MPSETPPRVLLIEDSDDDADLIARQLGHGFSLTRRATAVEVKEALATGRWDLVLSDWHVPGVDVPTVLRALKEHHPDTPCILLTGLLPMDQLVKAMQLGARDCFEKDQLTGLRAAAIREVISARSATGARREIRAARQELLDIRVEADTRERVTAMLNHEIRNPLNSVVGFIDLLSKESSGPLTDKQRRYLSNASYAATQLLELLSEALEMSRLSSATFALKAVVLELRGQLELAIEQALPLAAAKGSNLSLDCPSKVQVTADPQRLLQVLRNLVSNAIKHTPGGTSIALIGRANGDRVEVMVRDDGDGIPADQLGRVFEEYVQVGHDRSGTGLGLAICRQLTRLMNGELTVASSVGTGTTFCVALPTPKPATPRVSRGSRIAIGW